MKKITFLFAMLITMVSSVWALEPGNYLFKNYRSGKYAVWTGNTTQMVQSATQSLAAVWVVRADGKLGNMATDKLYASINSFTDEGATTYIKENPYNTGYIVVSLSENVTDPYSCWDDNNGKVGTWQPSETDNEGTSWEAIPVSEAEVTSLRLTPAYNELKEQALAAYNSIKSLDATNLITSVDQLSSPYTETYEGKIEYLIDNDPATFWHSQWSGSVPGNGVHYLQIALPENTVGGIQLTYVRRQTTGDQLTKADIIGVNSDDTEETVATLNFNNPTSGATETGVFYLTKSYPSIRILERATTSAENKGWWHAAEIQLNKVELYRSDAPVAAAALKAEIDKNPELITLDVINALQTALDAFAATAVPAKADLNDAITAALSLRVSETKEFGTYNPTLVAAAVATAQKIYEDEATTQEGALAAIDELKVALMAADNTPGDWVMKTDGRTGNNYLGLDGTLRGTSSTALNAAAVTFESAGVFGQYILSIDGNYFTNCTQSSQVGVTTNRFVAQTYQIARNDNGTFGIQSTDGGAYQWFHLDGNNPQKLVGWDKSAEASQWAIAEVPERETITYQIKDGEDVIWQKKVYGTVGSAYPECQVNSFVSVVVPEGTISQSETKVVGYTSTIQIQTFGSVADVTQWYTLDIHGTEKNYQVYNDNGDIRVANNGTSTTYQSGKVQAKYAWAFIGNPITGVKVYNKEAGKFIVQPSDADVEVVFGNEGSLFQICATNTAGYFALKVNGRSYYINHRDPKIQGWTAADEGSSFRAWAVDIEPSEIANMRITSAQWGTFWAPFAVEIPEGVKAYTGEMRDGWIKMTEVEGVIPANTGVVVTMSADDLDKREGGVFTADLSAVESEAAPLETCYTGNETGANISIAQGAYLLQKQEEQVGWYKVMGEGFTLAPNRCYLTVGTVIEANAESRTFIGFEPVDGDATGISTIASQAATKADGKYMVNGQIVVVKSGKAYNVNGTQVK